MELERRLTDALESGDVATAVELAPVVADAWAEQPLEVAGPRLAELSDALFEAPAADEATWNAALTLQQRRLELTEADHGPDHEDVATVLGDVATILYYFGRWDEAVALDVRALDIQRARLEPLDPRVARAEYYLGLTRYRQGRFSESEELLRSSSDRTKERAARAACSTFSSLASRRP